MIEGGTEKELFGSYYQDFDKYEQQTEGNETTLEKTNIKDEDNMSNKKNQEVIEKFNDISNDIRKIRIVDSDGQLKQPAKIKTNHANKNNNHSYQDEKKELKKKVESCKENEECEKNDTSTKGFLNQKRPNPNPKFECISNEEKRNGKKENNTHERIDNQRIVLFINCLKSIIETIFNLSGNIIKNKDMIFKAVINYENIKNVGSKKTFAKKKIIDIFLESVPRKYNDQNIIINQQKIENLCNNYKFTEEGTILNILFNMSFECVLSNNYLKDNRYIKDEYNDEKYELKGFKTFEQDYADKSEKFKKKLKKIALKLNPR